MLCPLHGRRVIEPEHLTKEHGRSAIILDMDIGETICFLAEGYVARATVRGAAGGLGRRLGRRYQTRRTAKLFVCVTYMGSRT